MPLYLVATPIGNLKDITLRALEVLKAADIVACEDTRVSGKLLSHYGIGTRTISYNDHNAPKQRPYLLELLAAGKTVALISDAGTPLISDPGYKLVKEAAEAGYAIFPIPGACAAIAALTVSGLPTDHFFFLGFLPSKAGDKTRLLESVKQVKASLVLYESAPRLAATLDTLRTLLGEREACVAREITKLHEEARRGTFTDLLKHYDNHEPKGEIVIVIAPPQEIEADDREIEKALKQALKDMSVKDAATFIAEHYNRPRKEIYRLAINLSEL